MILFLNAFALSIVLPVLVCMVSFARNTDCQPFASLFLKADKCPKMCCFIFIKASGYRKLFILLLRKGFVLKGLLVGNFIDVTASGLAI
jgi:type IV secretory pathway VirB3-like protein